MKRAVSHAVKARMVAWTLYALIAVAVVYAYVSTLPSRLPIAAAHTQNKVLEANAQLLMGAFALVVTVALVVAQLAFALGHGRGVRPKWRVMAVEMSLFAVAIGITLVARLLGQGCWKDALTHASSFLTLGSLVVLPPYFWHQRTYISTDGVLDDAFHKRARGVVKNNIEDVLLGAARRGDYVLFRDGVDRLAKDAEYLPYLRQMKKSLEGDVYALEIVTAGLRQLGDPDEQAPDGVPGIQ